MALHVRLTTRPDAFGEGLALTSSLSCIVPSTLRVGAPMMCRAASGPQPGMETSITTIAGLQW